MKILFAALAALILLPTTTMLAHANGNSPCDKVSPSVKFAAASLAEIYHDANHHPDDLMAEFCQMNANAVQANDGSVLVTLSTQEKDILCTVKLQSAGDQFQFQYGSCGEDHLSSAQ